ncbi:hypothetical protein QNM99_12785 [Pseudomonas sp. PCH446]
MAFPYFAGESQEHFQHVAGAAVQYRRVPVHSLTLADGSQVKVATVFDLSAANLAIDRGLGGANVARDYDDASVPGPRPGRNRSPASAARRRSRSPVSSPTTPTRPVAAR